MLSVLGPRTLHWPSEHWSVSTETSALPLVPACTSRSLDTDTRPTPEKFTSSNSCSPELLSNTCSVTMVPPVQEGSIAPRQAVSSTLIEPVPVKPAPAIDRLRSVIPLVLVTAYWKSESCSRTPLAVDAPQPALHWSPGLPGVVIGVV